MATVLGVFCGVFRGQLVERLQFLGFSDQTWNEGKQLDSFQLSTCKICVSVLLMRGVAPSENNSPRVQRIPTRQDRSRYSTFMIDKNFVNLRTLLSQHLQDRHRRDERLKNFVRRLLLSHSSRLSHLEPPPTHLPHTQVRQDE